MKRCVVLVLMLVVVSVLEARTPAAYLKFVRSKESFKIWQLSKVKKEWKATLVARVPVRKNEKEKALVGLPLKVGKTTVSLHKGMLRFQPGTSRIVLNPARLSVSAIDEKAIVILQQHSLHIVDLKGNALWYYDNKNVKHYAIFSLRQKENQAFGLSIKHEPGQPSWVAPIPGWTPLNLASGG